MRVLSQFIEAPKGLYFFESAKEKLFFLNDWNFVKKECIIIP